MIAHQAFLESHSSLKASMDDFEAREFSPTFPDIPLQNSGFRSGNVSEYSEQSSRRSYSPPAWRKAGSGWFHHHGMSLSKSGFESRESSPQYHDAEDGDGDVTAYRIATNLPLPRSPTKGRSPSNSPEPQSRPAAGDVDRGGVNVNTQISGPGSPTLYTPTQSNCKYSPHVFKSRSASATLRRARRPPLSAAALRLDHGSRDFSDQPD